MPIPQPRTLTPPALKGLNGFRDRIVKSGFTRINNYSVNIPIPLGLLNSDIFDQDNEALMSMYCMDAMIPPRNLMTAPTRVEHSFFEMPYNVSYEPATFTFYLDRNMTIRDIMMKWHELIYDHDYNGVSFYDDYKTTIDVFSLRKETGDSEYTYSATLMNAYPKSVGAVQFSASDDGQIATMPVQFVFERQIERTGDVPQPVAPVRTNSIQDGSQGLIISPVVPLDFNNSLEGDQSFLRQLIDRQNILLDAEQEQIESNETVSNDPVVEAPQNVQDEIRSRQANTTSVNIYTA